MDDLRIIERVTFFKLSDETAAIEVLYEDMEKEIILEYEPNMYNVFDPENLIGLTKTEAISYSESWRYNGGTSDV